MIRLFLNFFLFVFFSISIGMGSAWYMIEAGNRFSVVNFGPWTSWKSAGSLAADPYTRAHFTRSGRFPIASTAARYFSAQTDSDGWRFQTYCEYHIQGSPLKALWWSLAIYDERGKPFENKLERYAFNSLDIIFNKDETYQIHIAQSARPGNWLPVHGTGTFKLLLRIYHPEHPEAIAVNSEGGDVLPKIVRGICK